MDEREIRRQERERAAKKLRWYGRQAGMPEDMRVCCEEMVMLILCGDGLFTDEERVASIPEDLREMQAQWSQTQERRRAARL